MFNNSATPQGTRLETVSWNSEEYCRVGSSGVSGIVVDQVRGNGGFVDVARITFDNGQGDLIAPLHMLSDFHLATPPQGT
jgi:hypothetical protein